MNELPHKWNLFIAGDEDAFEWLYKTYASVLHEYGLRFTSDRELIKDCIHDLFITLYRNRKSTPTPNNIKVYLLVSLKNRLLNSFKHAAYTQHMEDGGYLFSLTDSVEDEYIKKELDTHTRQAVEKILSLLTERQKEIIYYRYIQELQMDEICELMDITYQSAHNLIQKAFQKVRNEKDNRLSGFSVPAKQKRKYKNLNLKGITMWVIFF
ncbi:MAG: sigma-70 family RNA polymerase sigma factor [Tannerellaceae bacterium]|nr:sigma-70 family RNA polymerase sigma factor [Tannerellaceae bacterium]